MALIYIVEDDESILEIEELTLRNAGHQVEGFTCAADFYQQLAKETPDCCIVDIMLPDQNGNEIVKNLRTQPKTQKLPIIMVTAKSTDIDLVRGIEAGADDYIKKPFSVLELISRVKALLRRSVTTNDKTLSLDDLILDEAKRQVTIDKAQIELTYKEYELLRLFLHNCEIVLNRNTILDKIWGTDFEGESRTLDMHIKTLRQKLGTYGSRIKTVRNVGYVLK